MIEISHQQAQRLLRSHLDTRLPNEQWLMLQAHLETCEPCRAYNEGLVGLEKALKRSLHAGWDGLHGPSAEIGRQVITGLQTRARLRKRLLAAGVGAALILVTAWLGGPSGIRARFLAAGPGAVAESGAAALTPSPEATSVIYQPTVEPGQFTEVIAYEGRRGGLPNGDHDIYLLNPGSASVNLTDNPAQDTDPAWSPDGEWLAFLSDRTQKSEVFVTNITGSRVVQLTAEPGIAWQGPLSWSPDGKWITLSGIRTRQGDQHWIYLVALDGTGVRALAGSRGGNSPKFSPSGRLVAFRFLSGDNEGILVQDLESGQQKTAQWRENPLVPSPAPSSAFDWSPDGAGLAFVSAMPNPVASADRPTWDAPPLSGEPGSQVLAVRSTYRSAAPFTFPDESYSIDYSRWPGAFRGVTWAPGGAVAYLEDLDDARANDKPGTQPQGCWTLQVSSTDFTRLPAQETAVQTSYGGLCVEGGIDQTSWTADGRWVVVQGRLPSEDQRSIYALRMPSPPGRGRRAAQVTATPTGAPSSNARPSNRGTAPAAVAAAAAAPGTILRLSDDPWAGPLPSPRPRRTIFGSHPRIDPQPVKKAAAGPPPSNLTQANASGQILYVVPNRTMSVVASANPDGTGGRVLLATPDLNRCPIWSPDGDVIALAQVSRPEPSSTVGAGENGQANAAPGVPPGQSTHSQPGIENVFVLNPHTGVLRKVSQAESIPVTGLVPEALSYGCPVWSPRRSTGERSLAALVSDGRKTFLAVLPTRLPDPAWDEPAPQPRYIPVTAPDMSLTPVWSPDGETIFLLHSDTNGAPAGITVIGVPEDPQPLTSNTRPYTWQAQTVPGLAILPDGRAMLHLEVYGLPGSAHLHRIILFPTGGIDETGPAVYLEPTLAAVQNQASKQGQAGQPDQDPGARVLSGNLTWLSGSLFGVILRSGPQEAIKTRFYLYDMTGDKVQAVAAFEDPVSTAAWSPDGRWLMFSAESGLWGVDIAKAAQGQAGPGWISPQPVQDLDWK